MVVAMAGDQPVCSARIEFLPGSSFASLWGGGTLASWRGQGIYRALIAYRARLAAARGLRRWEGRIREGFQAMHARGDLAPGTDPDDLALATLAALQGGLLLTQIQRSTKPLQTALDAMLALIAYEAAA